VPQDDEMPEGSIDTMGRVKERRLLSWLGLVTVASIVANCGGTSTVASTTVPTNIASTTSSSVIGGSGDQATQALLKEALAAAKASYSANGSTFSQVGPPELRNFAPSITFVEPDGDVAAAMNQVGVSGGFDNEDQTVILAALSTTGTCWYLVDVARSESSTLSGQSGITAPGVWYGHAVDSSPDCNAPDNGPPPASSLTGGWSKSHF